MLPPKENMTDVISTRNIVKRKQPPPTAQIKKIKNETEILVRDIPNEGELVVALPPKTEKISIADIIQHPIFRRLKKNKDQADRITKQIMNKQPITINTDLPTIMPPSLPALMPPAPSGPLASVDISTMRQIALGRFYNYIR